MPEAEKAHDEESKGPGSNSLDLGRVLPILVALVSTGASALLVAAKLVEPAALAVASVLVVTGLLLRYRANYRLKDRWYAAMRGRLRRERRFTRLWVAIGAAAILATLLLPSLAAMAVNSALTLILLVTGVAIARRSALIEQTLKLAKASAAEECDRVRDLAETAASIPLIRSPEHVVRLAHYEVAPGQIGTLPFLALAVVAIAFFVYVGLALAVGTSELAQRDQSPEKTLPRRESTVDVKQVSGGQLDLGEPAPTYAEECPALPNPQAIGHGLGRLFRRDGAFKAGCGTEAYRVPETGTWVSAGICEGATRSVAVTSAKGTAAILYGDAARFAWTEAMRGNLLAAEASHTGGGEVNLIETHAGTYAFIRLDEDENNDDPHSCGEVTGTDRPFVELSPQMALLWLQLLEHRVSWLWPSKDTSGPEAVAFSVYGSGEVAAHGYCDSGIDCRLFVGRNEWPGSGTSYVVLDDLHPYMPD